MKVFQSKVKKTVMGAVDIILPPRCPVSGEIVDRQGMFSPSSWSALDFIAEPFCHSCGIPFDYEVEDKTRCAQCLNDPPEYIKARAAIKYNDHSRDMILGFKHADKTYFVESFSPWLMRAGEEFLDKTDFLIPVPLHYWRLFKRRYNQAALIAKAVSREAKIPCLLGALRRMRATPTQGHLNTAERRKNVRRAFVFKEDQKSIIKGKNITLIDDVYTTGATVRECTKVLKKAGAKEVNVLTLARVVKPGFYE